MRQLSVISICLCSALALAACGGPTSEEEVERAIQDVIASDEASLNEIMLSVADPNEAAAYYRRLLAEQPDRIDYQRGLGTSLVRAKKSIEAAAVWRNVTQHPLSNNDDKVDYADALMSWPDSPCRALGPIGMLDTAIDSSIPKLAGIFWSNRRDERSRH